MGKQSPADGARQIAPAQVETFQHPAHPGYSVSLPLRPVLTPEVSIAYDQAQEYRAKYAEGLPLPTGITGRFGLSMAAAICKVMLADETPPGSQDRHTFAEWLMMSIYRAEVWEQVLLRVNELIDDPFVPAAGSPAATGAVSAPPCATISPIPSSQSEPTPSSAAPIELPADWKARSGPSAPATPPGTLVAIPGVPAGMPV